MFTRRTVLGGAAAGIASLPACQTHSTFDGLASDALGDPLPGLAMAVGLRGKTKLAAGYGQASLVFRLRVTDRTLFHIGSVGKAVTAYAVLMLVEAGEVDLDLPISSYLDDLPANWRAPTVRHLLTHTSGLRDYDEADFAWDRPLSMEQFFEFAADPFAAPGECWAYSGAGYILLGWMIERQSGASYQHFISSMLARIGLNDARPDAAGDAVENRAEPYTRVQNIWRHAIRMETGVSQSADGGVLFSARDFAGWMQELRRPTLISASTASTMFEPVRLRSGRRYPYGFGWFLDQVRGRPLHHHDGSVPGYRAAAMWSPEADSFACAATNADTSARRLLVLCARLAEVVAKGATPLSLSPIEDRAPHLTATAKTLLSRTDAASIDAALLAPDLLPLQRDPALAPMIAPRFEGLRDLILLEQYAFGDCTARRYRIMSAAGFEWPIVVAHAPDGCVAWVLW
jgi:D-alanyl-D-alanine carboxypeptidase